MSSSFILPRIEWIDYCNALYADSTLAPLQRVLHAAARFVADIRPRDHATAALMALHWLPVRQRITYTLPAMYPDARCRVWTRDTVLGGHGGVCVTTYRQTCHIYVQLKRGFRYTAHSLTLATDRDPFLSQLHRRGITCRLTFDGSPPSPPSRDISTPICLWFAVRLTRPSHHLRITVCNLFLTFLV